MTCHNFVVYYLSLTTSLTRLAYFSSAINTHHLLDMMYSGENILHIAIIKRNIPETRWLLEFYRDKVVSSSNIGPFPYHNILTIYL